MPADMTYPYVVMDEYGKPLTAEESADMDPNSPDVDYEILTFVCQIRLSDIADMDHENLLPHTGMLYFFAPLDYFLGDISCPLDYHTPPVVLYSPTVDNLKPYEMCWEDTGESVFRAPEAMDFRHIDAESGDGHLMLVKPYQEEIESWHPDCVALLQLDECDHWHMRFYDCGTYYVLIPREALKARNWDAVKGDMFSY